jgi:hypothetical protein
MKTGALNYSTQAVESLEESASNFLPDMPQTARNIRNVANLLRQAVKFVLPDNGELFDDQLRALPAVFRLPYPITAAEFEVTTNDIGDGPLATRGVDLDRSSKRIALAVEICAENFDQFSWMLSHEKWNLLVEDGAIAIIPVYFIAEKEIWAIPPLGLVIPSRKSEPKKSFVQNTREMYEGNLPKGVKPLPLEAHTTDLMPEQASAIEQEGGLSLVFATAQQDCHDECIAIMGLIEVLSCVNVQMETLSAPRFINAKRLAKSKVPFFEFKVLTLDLDEKAKSLSPNPKGTHSSPRVHLRRGHIRRLPDRSIFVRAAVVGDKGRGAVMKEYAIKPPRSDA